MTTQTLLRVENVQKSFGKNQVLKDISFSVEQGQVVGIIGPSGGGKSTLLRCATLLETMDAGTLAYGDIVVAQNDERGRARYADKKTIAAAKRRFGLVFQNFNLFPHHTVLKNVMNAPVFVLKQPKEQAEANARELIAKMGLEGKEDMVPCELSGGQQQRVAIARALVNDPKVMLCDEATSALDSKTTMQILDLLKKINAASGVTMVIITHSMMVAEYACNRIAVIDHGHVEEEGETAAVFANPQSPVTRALIAHHTGDAGEEGGEE